ncbi:type II secretion system protein [Ammoniphilus sp. CFH 90114]|uniref:type II secretion system protein n=1 Tax=Ammoniphilus sp. CFH 90114 TaxID=2493665 RepID=UPI00100E8AA7|nr:prepilin-type N-terminal cleavage/methylation domain-containing protein [Ammoniphilus sp. CFH 90114]RXT14697.1 prepilin-type N-terminal cleavage/methylation domain-containing protein [Ammoniphilus sp. CFH 90114]
MNRIALRKNEQGVTLIELLAVMVILGILVAIAVPVISTTIQEMRTRAFISNAIQMRESALMDLKVRLMALNETGEHKVTYEQLIADGYIAAFLDPDTGQLLREDEVLEKDRSYVVFKREEGGDISAYVYLKGFERQIGTPTVPIAVSSLTKDHVLPISMSTNN